MKTKKTRKKTMTMKVRGLLKMITMKMITMKMRMTIVMMKVLTKKKLK